MQIIYQLLKWVIAFIVFEWDMWWSVKCDLHLCQAVEGEEGVCLYMCDAVALGDLTVAHTQERLYIHRHINNIFSYAKWHKCLLR